MQHQWGNSSGTHHDTPKRCWRPAVVAVAGAVVAASLVTIVPDQARAQRTTQPSALTPVPGAPASFADLVARVKPSVVSIQVVARGNQPRRNRARPNQRPRSGAKPFPDLPDGHPLNEFFRSMPRGENPRGRAPRGTPRRRRQAQGSGFVISADGFVVTNNHVISGAEKILVSFDDKEKLPAKLIGTDPRTDLALLKIEAKRTFPHVKFADGKNGKSREGDWVVAVGNPFGLGGTVTAGIISALSRDIGSGPYDFIQIDAAVNRGNSGGPTFNLSGEVIGVNTAIYSPSGGNVGIAFAVPAKTALEVIEELKTNGTVKRGWLGVKIQTITQDMADGLGLNNAAGALISEVTEDGPAANSGLRAGDAIVAVNDRPIEDSRDLARKIADYAPGTKVAVKVRRGDRDRTINVALGTFPGAQQASAAPAAPAPDAKPTALEDLGLALRPSESGEGVEIESVDDDTDAAEKGLRRGDVIVEVNSEKVTRPSDVDRQVKSAKKRGREAVLMVVKRNNQRRFLAIRLRQQG